MKGARSQPVGVTTQLDDASLQQFVNTKTNRPIAFCFEAAAVDGVQVGIICIEVQERPVYLRKDFGKLKAHNVYIRRWQFDRHGRPGGNPQDGGNATRQEMTPPFDEKLQVSLHAHGMATTAPPYGSGEPLHLAIDLIVNNVGNSPVLHRSRETERSYGQEKHRLQRRVQREGAAAARGEKKIEDEDVHHGFFHRRAIRPTRGLNI